MYSVDGQPSWNFFKNDFTNHIPNAGASDTKTLAKQFSSVTDWVTEVGLSNFASYSSSGAHTSSPVFPYELRLKPTGKLSFPDTYHGLFTDDLESIPSGSTLWEVYAFNKPCALGGTEKHIGSIIATSKQTTSQWGDKNFFVRHQKFDDDLKIHPEWAQYSSSYSRGNQVLYGGGCPFA